MGLAYACTRPFNNMDGLQQYVHRSMRMLAPRRWNAGSVQLEFRPREIGTRHAGTMHGQCSETAGPVQLECKPSAPRPRMQAQCNENAGVQLECMPSAVCMQAQSIWNAGVHLECRRAARMQAPGS